MEGLLWCDTNVGKPFRERLVPAVRRYRRKFSDMPTTCYVHLGETDEKVYNIGQICIEIKPVLRIPPRHFFLVCEDGEEGDV